MDRWSLQWGQQWEGGYTLFSFLKGSFEGLCPIDSLTQSMGNALLELGEWDISHPSTQRTNAGSVQSYSLAIWCVQSRLDCSTSIQKAEWSCQALCAGEEHLVHRITCVSNSPYSFFFFFLWLGLSVFQECLFCAGKYSWLCALHPSRAKWSTLSDLAPRGGRSTWNWDSMGEGATCLVPSIAISSSLLCLAGCLFTTVWQEARSLCQLISHFSINIMKWPIFLLVSF